MNEIPIDKLREIVSYDPVYGGLVWNIRTRKTWPGMRAGSRSHGGYHKFGYRGKNYYVHRAVWALHHGEWPTRRIDHRDREPSNNRIRNLRQATQSQNSINATSRTTNRSGFKGVSWHKGTRKWRACIVRDGKQMHLGLFECKVDAAHAYDTAAREMFGSFSAPNI